jgi:hypothetical protein
MDIFGGLLGSCSVSPKSSGEESDRTFVDAIATAVNPVGVVPTPRSRVLWQRSPKLLLD